MAFIAFVAVRTPTLDPEKERHDARVHQELAIELHEIDYGTADKRGDTVLFESSQYSMQKSLVATYPGSDSCELKSSILAFAQDPAQ